LTRITPTHMNRSIGVTRVCGQFDSLPNSIRHLPTSATLWSHNAFRCGSSASDFTVLMPKIVSPRTACFMVSAVITLANTTRNGRRNARMMSMMVVAQTSTIHAKVALRKNRNGSRTISVMRSSRVVISLPVMTAAPR